MRTVYGPDDEARVSGAARPRSDALTDVLVQRRQRRNRRCPAEHPDRNPQIAAADDPPDQVSQVLLVQQFIGPSRTTTRSSIASPPAASWQYSATDDTPWRLKMSVRAVTSASS